MSRFKKKDAYGQVLNPGDVCVRLKRDKKKMSSSLEFCIYERESWGGESSKGEFGRFITPQGTRSIKYTSVVFAFDPMGERRNKSNEVTNITREFYEGKRHESNKEVQSIN